jgi:SPP1 gp7 family putative phage head morphogenesis protein
LPRRSKNARRADSAQWARARKAEEQFARHLRTLARHCGALTRQMFEPENFQDSARRIQGLLERYAETLRPWAKAVAERMVQDVARRDRGVWHARGKMMGRELQAEIAGAPTGMVLRNAIGETAALITSLPLEAAQRVGELSIRALVKSSRANELAAEILRTGEVTKARANLIARTQTSTTATALVAARATHLGSEGYIWRTVGDADVRKLHRDLNGTFHRWSEPPVAGERGERAHAGQIYNCRCWAEVVLPEEL